MRATRVLDRFTVAPIAGGWKVGGEIDARLLDITHLRQAFRIEQQQTVVRHHEHRRRMSTQGRRSSRR